MYYWHKICNLESQKSDRQKNVWLDIISTNQSKKNYIKDEFLSYKLIIDCTYLVQPRIYNAFEGCVEGLEGYKTNYDFNQSSTRICVKCAFGIVKEGGELLWDWFLFLYKIWMIYYLHVLYYIIYVKLVKRNLIENK